MGKQEDSLVLKSHGEHAQVEVLWLFSNDSNVSKVQTVYSKASNFWKTSALG